MIKYYPCSVCGGQHDVERFPCGNYHDVPIREPTCGACGLVMTPADSRINPELFLHDACLPEGLKQKEEPVGMPVPIVYDYSAHAPVGCTQCAFLAQRERELLVEITALKARIAALKDKVIHG